jgi:TonB-linked SusC/RagA family outer membrane protein
MSRLRWFLLSLLALALPSAALAQAGTITGSVTDASNGRPLANVTVQVLNTQIRALTSAEGEYRLTGVPAGSRVVNASRIGFSPASRTVAVAAGQTATTNFTLSTAALALEGLVVSASGTEQRRRELGNSVATIQPDSQNLAPITNITELIQGRAAGVSVLQSAGTTGTGARIRIRGSNSISLANDPLMIVDGIRVNNSTQSSAIDLAGQDFSRFNDLNPEEIESIEILKGPAASALYGTAAANGVIQITTKRGRAGKTRWSAYSELGSIKDENEYPSNYHQYGTILVGANKGLTTSNCNLVNQYLGACTPTDLHSFNPLEVHPPFRTGSQRNLGLTVSGGNDRTQYYISGETQNQDGIYKNNFLDQINLRTNLSAQLRSNLDVSVKTGYIHNRVEIPYNDNAVEGFISAGILGNWNDDANLGYYAWARDKRLALHNGQKVERFISSATARFTPFSWLTVNGTGGMDIMNRGDYQYVVPNVFTEDDDPDKAIGSRAEYNALVRLFTGNLSAVATHNLMSSLVSTTTIGTNYNRDALHRADAGGYGLLAGTNSLNSVSSRFFVGEANSDVRTLGTYGSEQLALHDRIYLTAAVRGDKNSAFGQDLGWIWYPALSSSWVVGDEPWFPQTNLISSLRLRASYGQSGLTPGFRTANQYFSPTAATVGGNSEPAITVGGAGNADLKPERSREVEFGADLGFLAGRLGLELTHYDKLSRDALVSRNLAPSLGSSSSQTVNLGQVSNKGWESTLNAKILTLPQLAWDATATYSTTTNKLVTLGEGVTPIVFGIGGDSQRHTEGYPLGGYWGVKILGYNDADTNGIIDPTEIELADSATFLGTPFPTRESSLNTNLTLFRFLRVSALVDHKGGQKLLNDTEEFRCEIFAICRGIQDRTAPLGEQARAVAARAYGSIAGFVEDASFTKLREVSVQLTAPTRFTQRFGLSNVALTLSGRNLKTWTNYTGLDPELNSGGQLNFSTFDFLGQPPVRHYVARIDVSF